MHQLVINVTFVEASMPYLLDYIAYLPPQEGNATTSASMSINPSVQSTFAPIPTVTSSSVSDSGNKPIGAIVGGVIGGVALVVFTALAVWYLRRRASLRQSVDLDDDHEGG